MKLVNLYQNPHKELLPGALAAAIAGERVMVNHVRLAAGTEVPEHAHPEEQITVVLKGRLLLTLEGVEVELGPGDAALVPAGAKHAALAREETELLDVFSPVRQDLVEKLS